MRARDVVGRRIARVVMSARGQTNSGPAQHLARIVFDDGSSMTFSVRETEGLGYVIEPHFNPSPTHLTREDAS